MGTVTTLSDEVAQARAHLGEEWLVVAFTAGRTPWEATRRSDGLVLRADDADELLRKAAALPEPGAALACERCGRHWWVVQRQIQVTVEAHQATQPGCEPPSVGRRVLLWCAKCGAPEPQRG